MGKICRTHVRQRNRHYDAATSFSKLVNFDTRHVVATRLWLRFPQKFGDNQGASLNTVPQPATN
jgi:hypothetical protein